MSLSVRSPECNVHHLPSTDVSGCNDCFAWTTENASQIEPFISARLHVIGELDDDNVGQCFAVLPNEEARRWIQLRTQISKGRVWQRMGRQSFHLRAVCRIRDNLGCQWCGERLSFRRCRGRSIDHRNRTCRCGRGNLRVFAAWIPFRLRCTFATLKIESEKVH